MNVTTVCDTLKTGEKMNKRWDGKSDSELVSVAAGASSGGLRKFAYSRKEMEAIRFVNVKAQETFWQEMHKGLNKMIKKGYDELGNSKNQKHVNRWPNAEIRSYDGQGFQGKTSAEDINCDTIPVISMEFSCDGDDKGNYSNDLMQEWSEQEESDDEDYSIQRPAFFVKGEPDFESGPPEDGLEYLRRVRWEASQIPKVKVAKIDGRKLNKEQSGYIPKIPGIDKCPPHLVPSKQWEDEFIADFSKLRLAFSHLDDDTSDATSTDPHMIIFGPREHKSLSSKSPSSIELLTSGPTLSTITAMDPAARVAMLKSRINFCESTSKFTKNECVWLFALCAAVHTPLDAETYASLRCLLRRCAKLRAGKSDLDDEVVMLNILATISGKFFGQSEN